VHELPNPFVARPRQPEPVGLCPESAAHLGDRDARIVEAGELERLCGSPDHQGVCAQAAPYPYAGEDELLAAPDPLIVVFRRRPRQRKPIRPKGTVAFAPHPSRAGSLVSRDSISGSFRALGRVAE